MSDDLSVAVFEMSVSHGILYMQGGSVSDRCPTCGFLKADCLCMPRLIPTCIICNRPFEECICR